MTPHECLQVTLPMAKHRLRKACMPSMLDPRVTQAGHVPAALGTGHGWCRRLSYFLLALALFAMVCSAALCRVLGCTLLGYAVLFQNSLFPPLHADVAPLLWCAVLHWRCMLPSTAVALHCCALLTLPDCAVNSFNAAEGILRPHKGYVSTA